jgi:hypothetical protein
MGGEESIMSPQTEENQEKSEEISKLLLMDTFFSGFSFHTSFTLTFSRDQSKFYQGVNLPPNIRLHLLNDWWFYSKKEWNSRLKQFPQCEAIEPDEPVQSFELANLRWMNDSIVTDVNFSEDGLCIVFKNGKSLTVSSKAVEGYSWMIDELEVDEIDSIWSVVCEDERFYVKVPQ